MMILQFFTPEFAQTSNAFDSASDLSVDTSMVRPPPAAAPFGRKSRLLQAAPLPNKSAAGVTQACIAMLGDKGAHTITFDNGSEFSQHAAITDTIRVEVFFAKPYCSWQRGTNENTNGLLRQFFPKNMPLNNVCEADVNDAVQLINYRPRKVLGWKTPIEVWADG